MKTLQSKLHIFSSKIKESFAEYKVTLSVIVLFTIYVVGAMIVESVYTNSRSYKDYSETFKTFRDIQMPILEALFLFIVQSCFIETICSKSLFPKEFFVKGKTWKVCAFLISAVIAGLTAYGIKLDKEVHIGQISGRLISYTAAKFFIGYLLLLCLAIIYYAYKKSGLRFEEYVLKVFFNLMKTLIVYYILFLGCSLLYAISDTLFFDGYETGVIDLEIMVVLVTGLYLAPKCILAINDVQNEPGVFLRTIVKYILSVISICAIVIVYVYVLEIIIRWEMPSNEVFSIVSALFCFGMPVWIMANYYKDDSRYSFLLSILPYIFAPLICLQIYSIGTRIAQYGMTQERYLGIMLIIFEFGVLLIWRFRAMRRERMIPFLGMLVVVSVFIPMLNMDGLSNRWQLAFLEETYELVLSGEGLSRLGYDRMKGAYEYLKKQPGMENEIEQYNIYDEAFLETLNEKLADEDKLTPKIQYSKHSFHCCQMVDTLDVRNYKQMNMLDQFSYYDDATSQNRIEVDFSDFIFVIRGTDEPFRADISDFAQKCMDYEKEYPDADKEEISKAMKEYNRIQLSDDLVLFINHFEGRYQQDKNDESHIEWEKLNISGILLKKQD